MLRCLLRQATGNEVNVRYSSEHKQQTRQALLESSASLAKHNGFSTVGVDGLMKAIGLTGGAFYSHFPSKDDLFCAIIERELENSLRLLGCGETSSKEKLKKCLGHYLNMAHVMNPADGCAIPALGAEIARADEHVRSRAEHWLCELHRVWGQILESDTLAWAAISQSIGALVVARMLSTPGVQASVIQASHDLLCQQIDGPCGSD